MSLLENPKLVKYSEYLVYIIFFLGLLIDVFLILDEEKTLSQMNWKLIKRYPIVLLMEFSLYLAWSYVIRHNWYCMVLLGLIAGHLLWHN